jgi:glycosyltransferase involved in cell wall biosynthesis
MSILIRLTKRNSMKLFYDHFIFSFQKYGGISKYFSEVLNNIPRGCWELPILCSDNEYLKTILCMPQRNLFGSRDFRRKIYVQAELSKPYTIYAAMKKDFDVYHQTFYDNFLFPYVKSKRMVTTCHDLILFKYPVNNFYWKKIAAHQKKSFARADHIIAISQNTKREMIELFDIPENKITVIYHGADKRQTVSEGRVFDFPYILYVGARVDNKNWENFVRAYAMVNKKYGDVRLVCTWQHFSKQEQALLRSLQVEEKAICVRADEKTMARLYRDAEMFVYPSVYEGFGMPILEAMVYDCPVVLSNTSCFPEIAGDAGFYFNPYEIEDIAEKIVRLLTDSALRKKQIALGKERVAHFSWEKCAKEHLAVYRSLIM